jgi:cytochrome c6
MNSTVMVILTLLLATPTALAQNSGADTYKAQCAMCHAANGSGSTLAGKATKTPSFCLPEMLKMSDADFFADTKSGEGKMPAYAGKLTDAQIKELIAYIRTLRKK